MKPALAFALAVLLAAPSHAQTLSQALDQAWARAPQAGAFAAREVEAQAGAAIASGLLAAPASVSVSTLNDKLGSGRGLLWVVGRRPAASRERRRCDRQATLGIRCPLSAASTSHAMSRRTLAAGQ